MSTTQEPPHTAKGIIRSLGPGLILAASIVGSGELVATTRTGAEAGFSLLWLILLGCVIKVITQIEICRHCITHGETTVTALFRIPRIGKFIAWFWLITFLTGLGQLGGIVGGVGQALAIFLPVLGEHSALFWAGVITVGTVAMLLRGGFTFIEVFCTVLVASFTFLTIGNLFALQTQPEWAIASEDLRKGLSFGFPESPGALMTALAAFGIIGIGAAELVAYPYWCLEKGYGKWIGPREDGPAWRKRAKGWIRVLQWDAWSSMVIYTLSTVAFFLLGAAVLHRMQLVPEGSEMIETLAEIYGPVFGSTGRFVLLIGAFAVLFSTFFVSNATKARLMTDALHVFRFRPMESEDQRSGRVRFFSVLFPILCFGIYAIYPKPVLLILLSGLMQAVLLPMLGVAALYFRFRTVDPSLRSGRLGDFFLILSVLAFLVVGATIAWNKGGDLVGFLLRISG
ncbi:MAG: Nramp family divalent metal transporter [Verrucomicrobiales bacterium]|nr:Nramp family divalent metal transporter [Verrucomicrobiales bacterium]